MSTSSERQQLLERIRRVDADTFDEVALDVFRYQAAHCEVYAAWLRLTGCDPERVQRAAEIPHLPISLFKHWLIQTGRWKPELVFTSSGTTGMVPSRHALRRRQWYVENAVRGFAAHYGSPSDYAWLALLPAYLERKGSSLVFMAEAFIRMSRFRESGFFLHEREEVVRRARRLLDQGKPVVLLGVSFALLDLAEQFPVPLEGAIVMETGGMKGRRKELIREELHQRLCEAFGLAHIHSEYGMTELLSQAYAPAGGIFRPAPTMRVRAAQITDPMAWERPGRPGTLSITDLANVDTVAFIATEDVGRVYADGTFEVLGRLDRADMRGCNLMVAQ